jgi:presenilin-like A22 family membrane protease
MELPRYTSIVTLFVLAQLIGVFTVTQAVTVNETVDVASTGLGERPPIEGWQSVAYLVGGILLSTALILYIAKKNWVNIWKYWQSLATGIAVYLAASTFTPPRIATLIGAASFLARLKTTNQYVNNAIELVMYAGITVFLAPIFTVKTALALLAIMSVYDAYAVWKSKHMVTLAEFTRRTKRFPGLTTGKQPSQINHSPPTHSPEENRSSFSVLGGGDILFPLLFTATLYIETVTNGVSPLIALLYALITTTGATTGLIALYATSDGESYYPALPYLTTGVYAGFLAVHAVHLAMI